MNPKRLSQMKAVCAKADKLSESIDYFKKVINTLFGLQVKLKSQSGTVKFIPVPLELENKFIALLKEYYNDKLEKLETEYKDL